MLETRFSFEKLEVWQEARRLVVDTYKLVRNFPKEEKYAMGDQIRRAVVSVPSNIAEGAGRLAIKEQIHFLEIAYASLMELYCQLQIAVDLGYITSEELQLVKRKVFTTPKLISGLHTSKVAQLNGI